MKVYKAKTFARFANGEKIADASLLEAVERAGKGQVNADLGSGIIKQRIAREGQGRSGGYRTIIAFRSGECAVFLYGFAKNERQNIGPKELSALRLIGGKWLADPKKIAKDLIAGILIEVKHDRK